MVKQEEEDRETACGHATEWKKEMFVSGSVSDHEYGLAQGWILHLNAGFLSAICPVLAFPPVH